MADFAYIAIAKDGREKKGSMTAVDEAKVRAVLRNDGYIPIQVTEQNMLTKDINISIGKPVKPRELSIFCRQFTSILNAGVTIVNALEMLASQTENKIFERAILDTKIAVEKGETLASGMRANPKVFPSILINLVEAGEASGSLDHAFSRMAVHFEKDAKLKSLLKKAMIYPIVLIFVAIIVVIIMSVVVIPQFVSMFESMGTELPFTTRMVVVMSDFFIAKWYAVLIVAVAAFAIIKAVGATDAGKHLYGKMKISMPVFGKMAVKSASASFARTMSTLVSSGISITQALDITSRSMSNILFQDALRKAREEAEVGVAISEPIKECGLFPPMVHQMLKIGEETGNIEGMLDKVAEYYEDEVEIQTQGLTTALEPAIILIMAVIVGFIVLAIYQPMISMYSGLDQL
ncbi:MAG: type II secretion system F family protein [Lachnospiraceae bacterium]|nr:type II secretion system F family protein [Lachnospiraceae bacterium]